MRRRLRGLTVWSELAAREQALECGLVAAAAEEGESSKPSGGLSGEISRSSER